MLESGMEGDYRQDDNCNSVHHADVVSGPKARLDPDGVG
jgi:hypothetical protein